MLGRLIKNEFISTSHILGGLYLAALIAILFSIGSTLAKSDIMGALSGIILVLLGAVLIIVTFVFIIQNFNKSLYGDQGYLSFTLPVKSRNLLFAKLFSSFTWMLLSYVVFIGMLLIFVYNTKDVMESTEGNPLSMLAELAKMFVQFPNKLTVVLFIVIKATDIFSSIIFMISIIYFSLTVGNTRPFQSKSFFYAILFFFGTYLMIQNVLTKLLVRYIPFYISAGDGIEFVFTSDNIGMLSSNMTSLIFRILSIIGLFIITNYLMYKKVNIK